MSRAILLLDHGSRLAAANELLDQIAGCTTRGHGLHIKLGAGFVERQGTVLGWYNSAPPTKPLR